MNDGTMSCGEAGRRGGKATLATHGPEHFARIARKQAPRPAAYYAAIGARGGAALRARYDARFLADWGRAGGEKLNATRGKEWYAEIGRKGAAAKKAKREAAG